MLNSIKINKYICTVVSVIMLLLCSLLPVNSIIVNLLTRYLGISSSITIWKEVVIVVLIFLLLLNFDFKRRINYLFIFSISLITTIALYSSFTNNIILSRIILGFRFELLWLILLVSIIVTKTLKVKYMEIGIIIGFVLTTFFQLISSIFGNEVIYKLFGFTDGWGVNEKQVIEGVSSFKTPYCHSTDGGFLACRFTGGMPSANNYAGYLLLLIPYFYYLSTVKNGKIQKLYYGLLVISIILIFCTFSRFAILALILMLAIYSIIKLINNSSILRSVFISFIILLPILLNVIIFETVKIDNFKNIIPSAILRVGSSAAHVNLTSIALDVIEQDGINLVFKGYGLSETGPAAKGEYFNPRLSNFVIKNVKIGEKYNTADYLMSVPENWYLQLILNGGWIYAAIYIMIVLFTLSGLFENYSKRNILLLGLFGIIIANLFLHIWESTAVSTYFCLIYYYYKNQPYDQH
jgi:hypothetical protein